MQGTGKPVTHFTQLKRTSSLGNIEGNVAHLIVRSNTTRCCLARWLTCGLWRVKLLCLLQRLACPPLHMLPNLPIRWSVLYCHIPGTIR